MLSQPTQTLELPLAAKEAAILENQLSAIEAFCAALGAGQAKPTARIINLAALRKDMPIALPPNDIELITSGGGGHEAHS